MYPTPDFGEKIFFFCFFCTLECFYTEGISGPSVFNRHGLAFIVVYLLSLLLMSRHLFSSLLLFYLAAGNIHCSFFWISLGKWTILSIVKHCLTYGSRAPLIQWQPRRSRVLEREWNPGMEWIANVPLNQTHLTPWQREWWHNRRGLH